MQYISKSLSIMEHSSASATRGSRSPETGCEALIQAQGQRHPQSAKRSKMCTLNYSSFNNGNSSEAPSGLRSTH